MPQPVSLTESRDVAVCWSASFVLLVAGGDGDQAASRHRITCVYRQIEDSQFELVRANLHLREVQRKQSVDTDPGFEFQA
jgi:ketosteroid isomerase-like protein